MNLLILMAGSSDSFQEAGYLYPKPLYEISGKPLLQHVLENLAPLFPICNSVIVAVRQAENAKHHTGAVVQLLLPSAHLLEVPDGTAGAACTALLAADLLVESEPLVIANGDQILRTDLPAAIESFQSTGFDGGILVFNDVHPRWSFVKTDSDGFVVEAAEKRPISNLATTGFYYFSKAGSFIRATQSMILKGASVNGLFYVCPAYNEMILAGSRIGVRKIEKQNYISLATLRLCEHYEKVLSAAPDYEDTQTR